MTAWAQSEELCVWLQRLGAQEPFKVCVPAEPATTWTLIAACPAGELASLLSGAMIEQGSAGIC